LASLPRNHTKRITESRDQVSLFDAAALKNRGFALFFIGSVRDRKVAGARIVKIQDEFD
jgi:hypothetical protein